MNVYEVKWCLGRAGLIDMPGVVETLRERGWPHSMDLTKGTILVRYEVGGEISDLWDLRGVVEEVAQELGAYYDDPDVKFSRPIEVPNA